jgi:branched-chain amino acid transport system ATP-binding protein
MAAVTLLETRGLTRRFGGLEAVAGVDLVLPKGEIRALIGPNGAGKTTLVSLVSGRLSPSSGSIHFEGEDLTGLPSHARVMKGIVYTFQITSVFANLSVVDNVALAVQRRHWGAKDLDARALAVLGQVGLAGRAEVRAGSLAYGHQRLLEVAIALALEPKLLVLDEPTQGLAEAEIADFCRLVREIAKEATVLLIEHNMGVVMELAQRITVLSNGRILAEGTPTEIRANRAVQQAYLGT